MRSTIVGVVILILISGPPGSVPGHASETPMRELMEELGLTLSWDSVRGFGAVSRGGTTVRFRTDSDIAVRDYTELVRTPTPFRRGGGLVVPSDFAGYLREVFPRQEDRATRRIAAIFVDPGHGGIDPGTIGRHVLEDGTAVIQEKDIVLNVSERLIRSLSARFPRKDVILSRDGDYYLTLEERTEMANALQHDSGEAVLFISIHANASLNRQARGFEVWYLPMDYRRRDLISPSEAGVNDPEVLTVLNTLREEEITIESVLLARNILFGLDRTIGDRSPNRGLKEESWYVVRNAKMPSVLVEIGFVTNEEEFQLLQSDDYLSDIVEGIYNGVVSFVDSYEELASAQ